MLKIYLLAWLPMTLIAISNGLIRELTYGKYLAELRSHQISTLTAIILFGCYLAILNHFWPLQSIPESLIIGGAWLLLTVLFEFSFGHFIAQHSYAKLLADYNILAGRIWLLVLLWLAISPVIFCYYRISFSFL
jgi:hypothetical protein